MQGPQWKLKALQQLNGVNNRMGISTFYWVGMQLTKQKVLETYMQYDEYTHKIYDCIIQNIVSYLHAMGGGRCFLGYSFEIWNGMNQSIIKGEVN